MWLISFEQKCDKINRNVYDTVNFFIFVWNCKINLCRKDFIAYIIEYGISIWQFESLITIKNCAIKLYLWMNFIVQNRMGNLK